MDGTRFHRSLKVNAKESHSLFSTGRFSIGGTGDGSPVLRGQRLRSDAHSTPAGISGRDDPGEESGEPVERGRMGNDDCLNGSRIHGRVVPAIIFRERWA